MNNLRLALRSLAKSRSFTAIALITLALGIGVNASMFSVVNTLLFRRAPFPDADQLVLLAAMTRNGERRVFSDQEIREIRPAADGFTALVAIAPTTFVMAEAERAAERVKGLSVSREMMETLRVQPFVGRPFSGDEFAPGKNQVVILSESFWHARFGGDRNIVGRTLRLDGETVTVIGVMPARFDYTMLWGNIALVRPMHLTPDQTLIRDYQSFLLIGRLKPGASAEKIAAQLAPLAATQEKDLPQSYPSLRYRAMPLHEAAIDEFGRVMSWMLFALSGFILLIGCANLANLQLARATASLREFAIRAALGASRTRLIAQQLTESVLLSLVGGALGLIVALWANHVLEANIQIDGAPGIALPVDGAVLIVTLVVSLFTGALFGIVPALFSSRADVNTALKQQGRGTTSSRGHHRVRHALIVGEIALAFVLIGGAAIVNRGFNKFLHRETGWETARVLTGALPIPEDRFRETEKRIELFRQLETRLAAVPGVDRVALSTSVPLFNYNSDRKIFRDAPAGGEAQDPVASHVMITADYFAAMGIPVLEGRSFAPDVKAGDPQVIVVNRSLAAHFWPHESALGKQLGVVEKDGAVWREIIGVVGDVQSIGNYTDRETRLQVYRPLVQEPWFFVHIVVRSENPGALTDAVRRTVSEIDPDMPVELLGTVPQFIDRTEHNIVVVGQTLAGFAALGLVLAAVGLYGVISNIVAQRTSEFGIRLALGAQPGDVLNNVLVRGMRLATVGLVLGLAGAYGLARFLGAIMPRVASPDPLELGSVALLLAAVTLLACWIPARRATKVDPMIALRSE